MNITTPEIVHGDCAYCLHTVVIAATDKEYPLGRCRTTTAVGDLIAPATLVLEPAGTGGWALRDGRAVPCTEANTRSPRYRRHRCVGS